MPITSLSQLDPQGLYTYADYLTWQFEERVELIRGRLVHLFPAPSIDHQRVLRRFTEIVSHYFKKQACEYFFAPTDVVLVTDGNFAADNKITTVVQPDLFVVCDATKIQANKCVGAPDWVIEIVSPSSLKYDNIKKLSLYQESGVREYWVVSPRNKTVMQYVLDSVGEYDTINEYNAQDTVQVGIFPDVYVDLGEIFAIKSVD